MHSNISQMSASVLLVQGPMATLSVIILPAVTFDLFAVPAARPPNTAKESFRLLEAQSCPVFISHTA